MSLIIGIDGCKAGWFSVWQDYEERIQSSIFKSLVDLKKFFSHEDYLIIGIDMPVILGDEIPRKADQLARKMLAKKASSIFTAPTPHMLQQDSYENASLVSKRQFGKSISLQSWYLFPKIKDVQTIIDHKNIKIYEIHPELSFRAMNNEAVVLESKKSAQGFDIRKALLDQYFPRFNFEILRNQYLKKEVVDDDILDAIAVLWSAKRIQANKASFIPKIPEKANMQIVY